MNRLVLALASAVVLSAPVEGAPFNYAAQRNGAVASSNGDFKSESEQHPASGAIDGTRDISRYFEGGCWLGSVRVSEQTPALWQVTFPQPTPVNRVAIYHFPQGGNTLVDFTLEHRDAASRQFVPVKPTDKSWQNPIKSNQAKISTLTFETIATDALRLVITRASLDAISQGGKGRAYILEFEAYLVDLQAELEALEQSRIAFAGVREQAATWRQGRAAREQARRAALAREDAGTLESPAFAWVREEKVRTAYTGLGAAHLAELMPELAQLGFNAMDVCGHRYASKPGYEETFAVVDGLAARHHMRLTPWMAWYWYPNDKDSPDRNCLKDLTREGAYRQAVDFRGTTMPAAPCPLSDEFWRDLHGNVLQVARWSRRYPRIWGLCLDFEFYGPSASRQSSDWYSYDFCFCDDCYGRFLRRIGSTVTPGQVPAAQRFAHLREAGAVEAYYDLLTDEVRCRAEATRLAAHAINPDFVLQFYGVPILPEPNVAALLEQDLMWRSWFGYALAQGFGTKRLPCLHKPLDASDARPGRWGMTRRMVRQGATWEYIETGKTLQQQLDELGLHALYVTGLVICDESRSADMTRALAASLTQGNGFWFNEAWMLLAFRKPDASRPGWWQGPDAERIENYWKMLRDGLKGLRPAGSASTRPLGSDHDK